MNTHVNRSLPASQTLFHHNVLPPAGDPLPELLDAHLLAFLYNFPTRAEHRLVSLLLNFKSSACCFYSTFCEMQRETLI